MALADFIEKVGTMLIDRSFETGSALLLFDDRGQIQKKKENGGNSIWKSYHLDNDESETDILLNLNCVTHVILSFPTCQFKKRYLCPYSN